jgi:putative sterol carrier protein
VPAVVEFLSKEWVEALDRVARRHPAWSDELDGLVLEYDIDDAGYHLVFDRSGVRAFAGAAEHPTVTFRCDRATAATIARGESSAQRAFMAGRLRIGGDATALMRAQGAIAALPDLFAALRPETDW